MIENTNKIKMNGTYTIKDLREIIKVLRSPEGCPWDKVQTHESMKQCLIEECYEVLEAIRNNDDENMKEELGDVLLQVVMHSQIAEERGAYTFDDVVQGISEKMIRRHPHVFGNENGEIIMSEQTNWEKIKQEEKKGSPQNENGPLSNILKDLPALLRAQKVLKKSDKIYGDRKTALESIDNAGKLLGEIREILLENGSEMPQIGENTDRIGNLTLEIVNIAKEIGENAENSLTNIIETFINKHESNPN